MIGNIIGKYWHQCKRIGFLWFWYQWKEKTLPYTVVPSNYTPLTNTIQWGRYLKHLLFLDHQLKWEDQRALQEGYFCRDRVSDSVCGCPLPLPRCHRSSYFLKSVGLMHHLLKIPGSTPAYLTCTLALTAMTCTLALAAMNVINAPWTSHFFEIQGLSS